MKAFNYPAPLHGAGTLRTTSHAYTSRCAAIPAPLSPLESVTRFLEGSTRPAARFDGRSLPILAARISAPGALVREPEVTTRVAGIVLLALWLLLFHLSVGTQP